MKKVDLDTLSEMGLRRVDVGDITLSESCSLSPRVLISQNGYVISLLQYDDLKEVVAFINSVISS
jgi:hypothetical protein